jgi:colanic acid/amylovoran/stewartan biosynthesis glycosyltransferase WcaL/AmsK/CpsK
MRRFDSVGGDLPIALQRCDQFVGRTMNWLYDHLRVVPDYAPVVLCDRLQNREEFPELEAQQIDRERLLLRIWQRVVKGRLYPPDLRELRRLNPRVLHSHFGYVAEGDLTLQRGLGCPWLIGFYGADVYLLGRMSEWQDRYAPIFDQASRVLALGPAMAAALTELGCRSEKIGIHPLGVDVEKIPSAPRRLTPGQPLSILYAGSFREKKGIPYLIHAVHLLKLAGVRFRLHLVGDASGRPQDVDTKAEVFQLIGQFGLEASVKHYSWLPFKEMLDLALQCHVFVAPSVTASDGDAEGTPFVIQQMMATGMPVITTQHSDIPFVFGEYSHLLVPERDARAIVDRVQQYVDSPDRIPEDGSALNMQVRRHFDMRECAKALATIYDNLERQNHVQALDNRVLSTVNRQPQAAGSV